MSIVQCEAEQEREVKGEKMAGTGANHLGLSFRLYNSGTE